MNLKKLLYVFTKAPYSNASAVEGLDAVLVGAAFEQTISLLFLHDGVFQLKNRQNTSGTSIKEVTKTFLALDDFGVDRIYVHDQSMLARGLSADHLMLSATSISSEQVSDLIAQQDKVFTF